MSAPPMPTVQVAGLHKSFRVAGTVIEAVNGIELTVAAGEIFGLLGPNGAGKTTTLRILTTLLPADTGSAFVAGADVLRAPGLVRQRIGYVGQLGGADKEGTGRENLLLAGRLYGLSAAEAKRRCAELLAVFDPDTLADRPVRTYSTAEAAPAMLDEVARSLADDPSIVSLAAEDGTIRVTARDATQAMAAVFGALASRGVPTRAASVARPTLDDVFLRETGRSLRDAGTPAVGIAAEVAA